MYTYALVVGESNTLVTFGDYYSLQLLCCAMQCYAMSNRFKTTIIYVSSNISKVNGVCFVSYVDSDGSSDLDEHYQNWINTDFKCVSSLTERCQSIEDIACEDEFHTVYLSSGVCIIIPKVSICD